MRERAGIKAAVVRGVISVAAVEAFAAYPDGCWNECLRMRRVSVALSERRLIRWRSGVLEARP